jgi:hypothetical protein
MRKERGREGVTRQELVMHATGGGRRKVRRGEGRGRTRRGVTIPVHVIGRIVDISDS